MLLTTLLSITAFAADTDALRAELERSHTELALEDEARPYYTRFGVYESDGVRLTATLGAIVNRSVGPSRALDVELRVGDAQLDNANFGWPFEPDGLEARGMVQAPGHPLVDRQDAWYTADIAYKGALENLARRRASRARQAGVDKPPSFEERAPLQATAARGALPDAAALEDRARTVSAVFLDYPQIEWSQLILSTGGGKATLIDSAGSEVERTLDDTEVTVVALVRAEDGLTALDRLVWASNGADNLPSVEQMVAESRAMAERLAAWTEAPVLEDEYVGPVVFEGEGAVSLFQQLLVVGMGGTPVAEMPVSDVSLVISSDESMALPVKRRVLPPGWSVVDDPAARPESAASFAYDQEGTPASRVQVVEDGVVRRLLMSRTPSRHAQQSTGHARGSRGRLKRAMATVVQVEPPKRVSQRRLMAQALKLAQTYELDHVLVVRRLGERARLDTRGWMMFVDPSEAPVQPPLEVVRRYADGREEPVRGLVFSGADRRTLRDVVAATGQHERTFLMDPDGGLPFGGGGLAVHVTAPSVLVSEMALVPAEGQREKPTPVPHPLAATH